MRISGYLKEIKIVLLVEGTDDIEFGWEIKAKRKGYEHVRLEEHEGCRQWKN